MLGYCREMAQTAGSYAAHSEMLWTEKGRRKGTESVQRDKPLDGSRGEAPSICNVLLLLQSMASSQQLSENAMDHSKWRKLIV